jgi:NitT/TauT family transport system substrate-binding protein
MAGLGAASSVGWPRLANAEPPPETSSIKLNGYWTSCAAPLFLAESLLRAEGFKNVQYLASDPSIQLGPGKVDLDLQAVGPILKALDADAPLVALAGVHLGCYELFAARHVRGVRDLKGKTVPVDGLGNAQHIMLSSMAAYVGLDPTKDINWVLHQPPTGMERFASGKADAYLGFPPEPQELRARGIGRVIVNTAVDKPWSQYFCCMVVTHRDFAQRYPVASKRATRAILKAADICATDPVESARTLVDKRVADNYAYTLESLRELRFDAWRSYDPEDTMRFYAVRLHDVGMIKSSPQKLIARGTDWRFLNELRRELKS